MNPTELDIKRLALTLSLCDRRSRVAVVQWYADRFHLDPSDTMRAIHREMREAFPQPYARKA